MESVIKFVTSFVDWVAVNSEVHDADLGNVCVFSGAAHQRGSPALHLQQLYASNDYGYQPTADHQFHYSGAACLGWDANC